jgi:hypothetical protein
MCTTELKKFVGCPRETRIIHDLPSKITFQSNYSIITVYIINYIKVKKAKVLHNISSQTRCSKLIKLKFRYYNHNSGVALVTLLQSPKRGALPKSQTSTHHRLPQRRSCNRDRNTPVYETHLQQGLNKP